MATKFSSSPDRNDRDQAADDNRSNQLNPNNDTYYTDRGHDGRPDDWQDR